MDVEFPFPNHENRDVWIEYLPQAQFILDLHVYSVEDEESERTLLFNVEESFWILGKYKEAENMYTDTRADREGAGQGAPAHTCQHEQPRVSAT